MGKSRLMAEVAGALHDNGVTVLVGRARAPMPGSLPALCRDARSPVYPTDVRRATHLDDGGGERRSAVVACQARSPTRARPRTSRAEAGEVRRDLFDAVARLFRALATTDRWRWFSRTCTGPSCRRLRCSSTWCRRAPTARLLVLATFRTHGTGPLRRGGSTGRGAAPAGWRPPARLERARHRCRSPST